MLLLGLVALEMNSSASAAAIATVISGLIAGAVSYLTKRSSDQASVAISQTTTRGDIEKEAFERAKDFYTDTIDRQAKELHEAEAEITRLKARVDSCETTVGELKRQSDRDRRTAQRLARAVYDMRLALGRAATPDPALEEAVVELLGEDES